MMKKMLAKSSARVVIEVVVGFGTRGSDSLLVDEARRPGAHRARLNQSCRRSAAFPRAPGLPRAAGRFFTCARICCIRVGSSKTLRPVSAIPASCLGFASARRGGGTDGTTCALWCRLYSSVTWAAGGSSAKKGKWRQAKTARKKPICRARRMMGRPSGVGLVRWEWDETPVMTATCAE